MGASLIIKNETREILEIEAIEKEERDCSGRLIPELEEALRLRGHLTAIVTLYSHRFRHYLKKPANLLHDRWLYQERGQDRGVLYQLGPVRGIHQDLVINPPRREAVVTTHDPGSNRKQIIVWDMKARRVVSNVVTYELDSSTLNYNYFYLNDQSGSLELIEPSVSEEASVEVAEDTPVLVH